MATTAHVGLSFADLGGIALHGYVAAVDVVVWSEVDLVVSRVKCAHDAVVIVVTAVSDRAVREPNRVGTKELGCVHVHLGWLSLLVL